MMGKEREKEDVHVCESFVRILEYESGVIIVWPQVSYHDTTTV